MCSDCNERFKAKLKPRNCSMCGDVFCKRCTTYRRKLSRVSATPDDLFGSLHNVCGKCFNTEVVVPGSHRDLMSEFSREKIEADVAKAKEMLCCSVYTRSKRKAMLKEIDRLTKGFVASVGLFSLSRSRVYDWQKSGNWVESCNANKCYECKKTLTFKLFKSHCAIGGQVFCAQCIKDDLLICQDEEGEPRWWINGKDHGQNGMRPVRFEIYKICSSCSQDLEIILADNIVMSSQKSAFMDRICQLEESILKMQKNVDKWLPEFQQEVEAVNLDMRSIKEVDRKLTRLSLNLSDMLSAIDIKIGHLLKLHQQPEPPFKDQELKVLKNVLTGTQLSYQEHLHQFHYPKKQLARYLSMEDQRKIQTRSSQESMMFVHANISELVAGLEKYTKHYNLDNVFLEDARKIELSIREELKSWPVWTSWEQHFKVMEDKPSGIVVCQMLKTSTNVDSVKYVVICQCSTIMQTCFSRLEDETLKLEFEQIKKNLKQAQERLEMSPTLVQFNSVKSCRKFPIIHDTAQFKLPL